MYNSLKIHFSCSHFFSHMTLFFYFEASSPHPRLFGVHTLVSLSFSLYLISLSFFHSAAKHISKHHVVEWRFKASKEKIKSFANEKNKRAEIYPAKAKNGSQSQERDGETIDVLFPIKYREMYTGKWVYEMPTRFTSIKQKFKIVISWIHIRTKGFNKLVVLLFANNGKERLKVTCLRFFPHMTIFFFLRTPSFNHSYVEFILCGLIHLPFLYLTILLHVLAHKLKKHVEWRLKSLPKKN